MLFQGIRILEKFGNLMFNFNVILLGILKEQKDPKINLNQYRILNILRTKNLITASEIANILSITPASMVKNIQLLSSYNLLVQMNDKKDRRSKILKITRKGRKKIIEIGAQIANKVACAKDVLNAEERNALLNALTKIDDALSRTI